MFTKRLIDELEKGTILQKGGILALLLIKRKDTELIAELLQEKHADTQIHPIRAGNRLRFAILSKNSS